VHRDVGCNQDNRNGGGAKALDELAHRSVMAADFDYGHGEIGPVSVKLFSLDGGAGEQCVSRALIFKHALEIERNKELFLDDEGSSAVEHGLFATFRPLMQAETPYCHLNLTCCGTRVGRSRWACELHPSFIGAP
jgi:hypothetical protein